jgi:hypothetical protein
VEITKCERNQIIHDKEYRIIQDSKEIQDNAGHAGSL